MAAALLDASALLAYLADEPGAGRVQGAIAAGAAVSAVNLAEVLSKLADRGADPEAAVAALTARGLLGAAVAVEPFSAADAVAAARLRPLTRAEGLSLGDRACLATAQRLGLAALTADRRWAQLHLPVAVELIR